MTPELIASIIVAVVAATVPGVIAMRQARLAGRATNRLEIRKVDAEAYDRAKAMYESSITQLEHSVVRQNAESTRLAAEVERLSTAVDRCEKAFELSRTESRVLIGRLRERIYVLEDLVRRLGGVVPAMPSTPPINLDRP